MRLSTINTYSYKINFGSQHNAPACAGSDFTEKLPSDIKEKRQSTLFKAIKYLKSDGFYNQRIKGKNYQERSFAVYDLMNYIADVSPKELVEKADELLSNTYTALKNTYKGESKILIPWSGGRDSTALLAASLAFFPEKEFKLITVLNGMTDNIIAPKVQANTIVKMFDKNPKKPLKVSHCYLDSSTEMKKYVVDSALDDKKILGHPAVCNSCKTVMEKTMAAYAKENGYKILPMGYTTYQAEQEWSEQGKAHMLVLENELHKNGIELYYPLYNILKTPADVILLLASLGIDFESQKSEMKCAAAGMNPVGVTIQDELNHVMEKLNNRNYQGLSPSALYFKRQLEFEIYKNKQTNDLLKAEFEVFENPNKPSYENLNENIQTLKNNKSYTANVFKEPKFTK